MSLIAPDTQNTYNSPPMIVSRRDRSPSPPMTMPEWVFAEEESLDDMAVSPCEEVCNVKAPVLEKWQLLCDGIHQYILDENLRLGCSRQESLRQQRYFANFIKTMHKHLLLDPDPRLAFGHIAHAFIYIRRTHVFRQTPSNHSKMCVHRVCRSVVTLYQVVIACFTIADKILNDVTYDMDSYARLAGLHKSALCNAELYTMHMLEWNASVSEQEVEALDAFTTTQQMY